MKNTQDGLIEILYLKKKRLEDFKIQQEKLRKMTPKEKKVSINEWSLYELWDNSKQTKTVNVPKIEHRK